MNNSDDDIDKLYIMINAETRLLDGELVIYCNPKTTREAEEVIRLAKIGLWAEKHAIPVLEEISKNKTEDCNIYTMGCDCDLETITALKSLPKKII